MANGASQGPHARGFIGVGLLGLGVVGASVAEALLQRADFLTDRVGLPLRLTGVGVRDVRKLRTAEVPVSLLTTDGSAVIADPDTDIVVELMGGEQPALTRIREALELGRGVVTANKEVMAKHGTALRGLAAQKATPLLYEAAVGGGIPLIATMRRGLVASRTTAIRAIINGTTNYILTRMAQDEMDFVDALAQAQSLGYAEADPKNDVDGIDAAYKLAILASLAFRTPVAFEDVFHEGITHLIANDFRYARELGYTIKLLAIAREEDGEIQARVHPTFLRQEMLLAKVDGVYNAVQIDGDLTGEVLLYGRGAGPAPTTSAVLSDVIEIASDLVQGRAATAAPDIRSASRIRSMDDLDVRYYIRMRVADRPGVLGQIALVLGDSGISMASVIQKETDEAAQSAEIIIMTHRARESAVAAASAKLAGLETIREIGAIVRVEE
ncbi:MAG: homoserine dehydrogenase [Chloroflexi bacterium]|nr:homoserine dehydrogenase [Chloroflexota bacterium]